MTLPAFLRALLDDAGVLQAFAKVSGRVGARKQAISSQGDFPFIEELLQKPLDPVVRKGLLAMLEMGKSAQEAGIADMTLDEINAEIAAARLERRQHTRVAS